VNNHSQAKQLLIDHEGWCRHFYLDQAKNVTVGVGHLLRTSLDASRLPFVWRASKWPTTATQISAEYLNVLKQKPGQKASYYRQFTQLELLDPAIEQLLDEDIASVEVSVEAYFQGYVQYPPPAQDGLIDMDFNLGTHRLVSEYSKLKVAAEERNWRACAAECFRRGVAETRNAQTRDLFLQAASIDITVIS
jgi:GH24 family phage-related lysozyme (muramidase)